MSASPIETDALVSRTPAEAAPISGSILGDPGASRMTVKVDVSLAEPLASAA